MELAKNRLNNFANHTGLKTISANNNVNVTELLNRYFSCSPPFAESGQKKNEFPDAIALMTLEDWAKQKNVKIIAVSLDKDWHDFGKASEYIDVTSDLAEAISIFQPHNTAFAFCIKLASDLMTTAGEKIRDPLESYLRNYVENMDVYAEGSSAYYFESDYVETKYNTFEFLVNHEDKAQLRPVQIQENTIVVESELTIKAEASSDFTFSVHDSIDNDDMKIGDAEATRDFEFDSKVLITLTGDFDKGLDFVKVIAFEVLSSPKYVDFGEIGPEWGYHELGYNELGYNESQ